MANWNIDPDHSVAGFIVRHMMCANVRGQFNRLSGAISFDPADIPHASVAVSIEAASIYTGIAKRDEHLRSPDFFDVTTHPAITFRSNNAEARGETRFTVNGDLTIRGVTRPVVLEVEYAGPVKSPFGDETTIGFAATTRINRQEFGVSWNEAMEEGGLVAGNEVQITLDIEADLAAD